MPRQFNTAGPCQPDIHYMLAPAARVPGVRAMVEGRHYFVLHAQRQVGKTTALLALARELTSEGQFAAVTVSCETGTPFEDLERAIPAMLGAWRGRANAFLPPELRPPPWPVSEPAAAIRDALEAWSLACPRPLVVFLDEVDGLAPEVLGSVLRQLRDGHVNRPEGFPWSLGLIGLRDLKDYVVTSGGTGRSGAGSPFNISAGSLTMQSFTRDEVGELYAQHTAETGQVFAEGVVDRAWDLTRGQPWLVNALAREATTVLVPDRTEAVTVAHINDAKETLVRRRDTHLQSLASRLREDRVRRIIQPLMAGEPLPAVSEDDLAYVMELGLIRLGEGQVLQIANPMYSDAFPRALANTIEVSLPAATHPWLDSAGRLDLDRLLAGFLAFWRQHGEPLMGASPYHEIAPHLVLMAWLHRVCNGGGSLDREFAAGTGRMDLNLRYGDVRLGIELKVWRDGRRDPLAEGITQIDAYLSRIGVATGWLVVFDRRTGQPPIEERTTAEAITTPAGHAVTVVRG
ncbi:hypothetical protein LBMAG42_37340 [Deltaproteobacteria bacterium]|nr:hypothetical protein LBMAG42_37340 [Deltaproteobacteria bacterium]